MHYDVASWCHRDTWRDWRHGNGCWYVHTFWWRHHNTNVIFWNKRICCTFGRELPIPISHSEWFPYLSPFLFLTHKIEPLFLSSHFTSKCPSCHLYISRLTVPQSGNISKLSYPSLWWEFWDAITDCKKSYEELTVNHLLNANMSKHHAGPPLVPLML